MIVFFLTELRCSRKQSDYDKEMLHMLRQKFQGRFHWVCLLAFLLVAAIGVYAAPQAGGYHVIRRMPVGCMTPTSLAVPSGSLML